MLWKSSGCVLLLLSGSMMSLQCKAPQTIADTPVACLPDRLNSLASPASLEAATESSAGSGLQSPAQLHLALAQSNPLDLLETALDRWDDVASYQLTLRSQERMRGVLGGMTVVQARVLREPASVSLRWIENAGRVDRLLWQPTIHDGKLIVHPTGLIGQVVKSVRVDPNSQTVRAATRRSVTRFGLANVLREVLTDYCENQVAGDLNVEVLGPVAGHGDQPDALLLKRVTADQTNEARTVLLWLDAETLRPLRVEQYGWQDELLGNYSFDEYQPLALTDADFTLAALGFE